MKKIIKSTLLIIAIAMLLGCLPVFAEAHGGPAIGELISPGDLAEPTDTHLIRPVKDNGHHDDRELVLDDHQHGGPPCYLFEYIISQDKDATDDINFLDFYLGLRGPDYPDEGPCPRRRELWNSFGYWGGIPRYLTREELLRQPEEPCIPMSFKKLLVRTTDDVIDLSFSIVSADWPNFNQHYIDSFWFGLAGGYEYGVPVTERILAQDCTLACDYYYHFLSHVKVSMEDSLSMEEPVSMEDKVKWTGTGDHEYYVECCDRLAFALLVGDLDAEKDDCVHYARDMRPRAMVLAHLSEDPFLRVRTTEAMNVEVEEEQNGLVGRPPMNPCPIGNRDFRAWDSSMYFDSIVDVPEGETFNMGVQYAVNTDCTCCPAGACCQNDHVPFMAVTNLGTESVFTGKNLIDTAGLKLWDNDSKVFSNNSWLCNSWCGLCLYDDFTSGDKGLLMAGKYENIADQSSLSDCPCRIYPAFTNTVKAAGNMDINYRAYKTEECLVLDPLTRIQGRFNTSWSRYSVSDLCDCCYYLYDPCDCLVEMYRNAIGWDVDFVDKEYLSCAYFNDELEYDAEARECNCAVFDVMVEDSASKDILLARLDWTVPAECLVEAGLVDGENWWRADLWNKLSITINGIVLNSDNVENVSANDLTPEELSFLTVVDGPQRNLTVATDIDVKLFVFVIDSDESAIRYYMNSKGNRFLVLYDGEKDGYFTYKGYVSNCGSGTSVPPSETFGVSTAALNLNLAVEGECCKELGTVNVPVDSQIVWTVTSTDLAMVSPEVGPVTTVMGLKAGEVVVTATVSGDESKFGDCLVTIEDEVPGTTGGEDSGSNGSSGGGCNAGGFAPAILLLLAPLAVFLKK